MAKRRLPLVLLVTALLAAIDPSRQSPVKNNNNGNVRKSMETFLERFGYMGDTSSGSVLPSDNLRTEEGFRAALRRMQKFAGLPATGRLDQATARMMKARRCGVPDVIGHAERVRRYALQGSKWDKTHLTWSRQGWRKSIGVPLGQEDSEGIVRLNLQGRGATRLRTGTQLEQAPEDGGRPQHLNRQGVQGSERLPTLEQSTGTLRRKQPQHVSGPGPCWNKLLKTAADLSAPEP
ncbi:uncharacterized protein ISCGN_009851 [Ixodes scapularis]